MKPISKYKNIKITHGPHVWVFWYLNALYTVISQNGSLPASLSAEEDKSKASPYVLFFYFRFVVSRPVTVRFQNNVWLVQQSYRIWLQIPVKCFHLFSSVSSQQWWVEDLHQFSKCLSGQINPFTPKIKMQILLTIHIGNVRVILWELIATPAIVWAKYKMSLKGEHLPWSLSGLKELNEKEKNLKAGFSWAWLEF